MANETEQMFNKKKERCLQISLMERRLERKRKKETYFEVER